MKFWKIFVFGLLLAVITVWLGVFASPDGNFHLIVCDVGEGDAILATYKNTQILVDGGPDSRVLDCLAGYLPFWDRKIELVVLTHPEDDHFGGLIEVFRRYRVDNFLTNTVENSSSAYQALKKEVGGRSIRVINPVGGQSIGISKMRLDILYPTREFLAEKEAFTGKGRLNDFSIVAGLRFGSFKALLTGDIQPPVTDEVAGILKQNNNLTFELLKVPHHGSKNGLTRDLLETVNPKLAVISVGKNQWGHPNQEVLKILGDKDIGILRTDQVGSIEVIGDGKKWRVKK